jgi:acyl-CoA thioester hydrolase
MTKGHFTYHRRVLFHETDLAGLVHFSNFYKYLEEAEHAFYRSLGLSVHPAAGERQAIKAGWPRVHASCDFKCPLFFEEEFTIILTVQEMRARSIRYAATFWKNMATSPVEVASAEMSIVRVEWSEVAGKIQAVEIPPAFREKITRAIEGASA